MSYVTHGNALSIALLLKIQLEIVLLIQLSASPIRQLEYMMKEISRTRLICIDYFILSSVKN